MSEIRVSEIRGSEIRGSEIRGSEIRVSEIRVSEIRVSEIRGSEIRGSEIRVSKIRVSEIRISSNHRELHGAIFKYGPVKTQFNGSACCALFFSTKNKNSRIMLVQASCVLGQEGSLGEEEQTPSLNGMC